MSHLSHEASFYLTKKVIVSLFAVFPLYNADGAFYDVVKLAKGTDSKLSLLSVLPSTGEIVVGSNGKSYTVCDADGNPLRLSNNSSTAIAVIYDDINGDARYYANRTPAYIKVGDTLEKAVDLAVFDNSLATVEEEIEIQLFGGLPSGNMGAASAFATHKINDCDTAEIIGFQEISIVNGVRYRL